MRTLGFGKDYKRPRQFSSLITSPILDQKAYGKLYCYEYWSSWQWRVTPQDATFKQLQSSDALRYIGYASLIKKNLDYEESLKLIALLTKHLRQQ